MFPNRVRLLYEIPVDGNLATLYNYLLSRGRSIIEENIGSPLPDVDEMVSCCYRTFLFFFSTLYSPSLGPFRPLWPSTCPTGPPRPS